MIFLLLFLLGCQNTAAYFSNDEIRDEYKFAPVPSQEPIQLQPKSFLIEDYIPTPTPIPSLDPTPKPRVKWNYDPEVSWYGPGFYGKRTACGLAYTKTLLGVAHRSLPCGAKVTFMWKGKAYTVPVIDRGPYIKGRTWDLSGGLCVKLNHCFTGPIYYRIEK